MFLTKGNLNPASQPTEGERGRRQNVTAFRQCEVLVLLSAHEQDKV